MSRKIYYFGTSDADVADKNAVGGKGFSLAEMSRLGMPVPHGFTLSTAVCREFMKNDALPERVAGEVAKALTIICERAGQTFGTGDSPLLLSVRSGAAVSMPGMMDTILNVGLNDTTTQSLAARTGDERFAYDCYRRLVAQYGATVMGVADENGESPFQTLLSAAVAEAGVASEQDLDPKALRQLVTNYKIEILKRTDAPFPEDPMEQLLGATTMVFRSWNNARARSYRAMHNIDANIGTAVNVQQMVFGNRGDDSGTGVAFTRNPSTGASGLFGEFLPGAQGEDIVSGTRTPRGLDVMQSLVPEAHAELLRLAQTLESHFLDMQDIEFTVEAGKLWLLQARAGKRSGAAMVQIALDLVNEGKIGKDAAVLSLDPEKLNELMHPRLGPDHGREALGSGLPASPGASIGVIALSNEQAAAFHAEGQVPILVRRDTSPEDIDGMKVSGAIITERGGMTSHAAVVARGMGIPCITAARGIRVSAVELSIGDTVLRAGDTITVDGSKGQFFAGALPLTPAEPSESLKEIMEWIDGFRRLKVRANADTPDDAKCARSFGAEGVGLCRTEHMFFAPERLVLMRKLILGGKSEELLSQVTEAQRGDFRGIFSAMQGFPVTIRLLDPPLHEFLPKREEAEALAEDLGLTPEEIRERIAALAESNPMLGHRGCRLGVTHPELYAAQGTAIAEAACDVIEAGGKARPEIMIPFVSVASELAMLRQLVAASVEAVQLRREISFKVLIGTMIELPRACIVADEIAAHADFFSFGTNDLTQTIFGFSRDDSGKFLPAYLEQGIVSADPFTTLDRAGVGKLIQLAVEKGRSAKTKLKIGICGEHGGDPASIDFCHAEALDYVSCSPFRVSIAKLAAAQAHLGREARIVRQP